MKSVTEQIEEIINNEIVRHEKEIILEFTIKHALKKPIYSLKIGDKIREEGIYVFSNKEDVLNFLKEDFWKIYGNVKEIKWEDR